MTDSHVHLTIQPLSDYTLSHLKTFKDFGGKHLLNVAYTPESLIDVIQMQNEFENSFPNMIHCSSGIHPEYLLEKKESIKQLTELLIKHIKTHLNKIKAIGECGLDYYQLQFQGDLTPEQKLEIKEDQKQLFRHHIELAKEFHLPLTIHTRDEKSSTECTQDALRLVSIMGNGNIRGCFHSFTGSQEHLEKILSLGFYIGFNGIVTYPKAENVREILRLTPLSQILLETDAPLLPPQKVRNGKSGDIKYGSPKDIYEIAQTVAKVKNVTVEKIIDITTENYEALFLSN